MSFSKPRPPLRECTGADDFLIRNVLSGDRHASRDLWERLSPVLYARARRFREVDSDDLVQHAWVALLDRGGARLAAYDHGRGISLESYIGLVAHRLFQNAVRGADADKRRALSSGVTECSEQHPERIVVGIDLARRLAAELAKTLPSRGRLVLWYSFYCQFSVPEVALQIKASRQVVYNWQYQIRSYARAFLGEHSA